MKRTYDLMNDMDVAMMTLDNNVKRLRERYQVLNRRFDSLYHKIETAPKFDMYKGYLYAKELQEVLQERRIVKSELKIAERAFEKIKKFRGEFLQTFNTVKQWENGNQDWRENFQISHEDIAI
jgi:prefoldin subunit 5